MERLWENEEKFKDQNSCNTFNNCNDFIYSTNECICRGKRRIFYVDVGNTGRGFGYNQDERHQ